METGDEVLDAALKAAVRDSPDRPAEALQHSRAARDRADTLGNRVGHAYALLCEGSALLLLSEHESALRTLTLALTEMEPLGDLAGRSYVLGALAGVHVSLGHLEEALQTGHDALRLARALDDREQEAWMLAGLGNSYLDLGEVPLAMDAGQKALRLFGTMEDPGGQARSHTVLGGALRRLKRLDEARIHHEAALRIAEEAASPVHVARALHDLGELEQEGGRFEAALVLYRRALGLRQQVGNRQAQATSLLRIGETLSQLDQTEDALAALREALAITQQIGALPRLADVTRTLADVYERAGRPVDALVALRQYQAHREALLVEQARTRLEVYQVRADAERARQDAEIARVRTEELGKANRELADTLRVLQTAQRELVQAEKLASLGRLSAGLAHEIRNPLNFIAGFAEVNVEVVRETLDAIRAGAPPDEVEADLEAVIDNAERVRLHARRAEGIVQSLMGHVRDVGGERQPVDLRALLDDAIAMGLGPDSPVQVVRAYAADATVEANPGSLQRVFVNLVDNAAYALRQPPPDGLPPTLHVATRCVDGGVEIDLSDNGHGLSETLSERVFEPFFTTKPPGEGTGLGLSLAYDIVTAGHGGSIDLVEPEGPGARFRVWLPTRPPDA